MGEILHNTDSKLFSDGFSTVPGEPRQRFVAGSGPYPGGGAKPPFRSRETATAVIALPPSLTARGLAPDPELRPSGGIGAGPRRAGRRCPRRHRVKVGGHHPAGTRVARQPSALRAWNHGDAGCRGPWMSPSSRSSAITWTGTAMATGRSGRNTPVPWPSRGIRSRAERGRLPVPMKPGQVRL